MGRKANPGLAEEVRDMYRNTKCSLAQVAKFYRISPTTASNMVSRKGAYAAREALQGEQG